MRATRCIFVGELPRTCDLNVMSYILGIEMCLEYMFVCTWVVVSCFLKWVLQFMYVSTTDKCLGGRLSFAFFVEKYNKRNHTYYIHHRNRINSKLINLSRSLKCKSNRRASDIIPLFPHTNLAPKSTMKLRHMHNSLAKELYPHVVTKIKPN